MEFATGAFGALLPKLAKLLHDEYKLQKNVRKNIESLKKELEFTCAALRNVGDVPPEELKEVVKLWARDARELSYDMDDVVDTFLVHVEGPNPLSRRRSKRFIQKMKSILAIGKRHQISEQMKEIKKRVMAVAARRDRYKDDIDFVNHVTTLDPRITAFYTKETQLVGLDEAREELIMKLTKGDDMSTQQKRIVSIVGFGGLGKTTLAKAVYDKLKVQFDSAAFVTVSRTPDMKKFLKNMLYELDDQKYRNISTSLDVYQLINLARGFLNNKRYFLIIDDIWDIPNWDIIKCALPDGNSGCRIITTTRIITVAEHIGGAYKMKALSEDNSKSLMYARIFGNEDLKRCHAEDLAEVSNKILRKCAGVPLAIITIASLLASKGRNEMEWYNVYNSIGSGMKSSLDAAKMRKILSYSYYDLPSHLRTCLLYLSVFPEDFKIQKDRLIRLWIAEGFIQFEEKGKSLFEIGESYFSELINRSMILPVDAYRTAKICQCRVHDMVLDLLHSLSSQENLVTILNDTDHTSALATVRRMSLQNGNVDHASTWVARSTTQVRSVVVFPPASNQMPVLQNFKVLRVLDLQDCDLSESNSLNYLGRLFHLRYLNLRSTRINQLPEEVGNLQFLETLDVGKNMISHLPMAVAQLKYLLSLTVDMNTRLPNGIGSLRFLEKLSYLHIDNESTGHIKELGFLTELRVLCVAFYNDYSDELNIKFVESISKLRKIHTLHIKKFGTGNHNIGGLDAWVAPWHLRCFMTKEVCRFSRLPSWINNSSHIRDITITVRELQYKDLNVLGRLPTLRYQDLHVDHEDAVVLERIHVGGAWFPCLELCKLHGFAVVFQQGAMPRLKRLEFDGYLHGEREITVNDGGFDLGLRNLSSLEYVKVRFRTGGASEELEKVMAAVRESAGNHPNKPILKIHGFRW